MLAGASVPGAVAGAAPVAAVAVVLSSALTMRRSSYSLVNSWLKMPKSCTRSRQAWMTAARGVMVPSVWTRRMNLLVMGLELEGLGYVGCGECR